MLYERATGTVTPFDEDEKGYLFLFFCGEDDPIPVEQNMPKGDKHGYICKGCKTRISVENIGRGPYLRFWNRPESHYAAKPSAP